MARLHFSRRTLAVLTSSVLASAVYVAAQAHSSAAEKDARVPQPHAPITAKGEQCVEPTDKMRRDHMNMILHQRDETMHKGIRTTKHSLKNCINCHADPKTNTVLGEKGFCVECHSYAAVKMDCFSCHSPSPEKTKAASAPASRLDEAVGQVVTSGAATTNKINASVTP